MKIRFLKKNHYEITLKPLKKTFALCCCFYIITALREEQYIFIVSYLYIDRLIFPIEYKRLS
jgi:hypothetical protein